MKTSLLSLFAGLVLLATRAPGAETRTDIRLGTLLPSGTAQHQALQEMGEQWRTASGGNVRLTLYPDGRLGGEAEMVRKLRIGQINGGLFSVVGLAEIDPGVAGLQLMPMVFNSWDEVDHVREQLRGRLEERLRAKGFEVLFWADAGWVRFFSKEAVVSPADFKRMKIFVWAGDQPQLEMMQSLGYRAVSLETTDILLGLNTGLVSTVPMPPLYALAGQMQTAAPHMLDLKWCPIVGAALVRSETWEKLSPETRARLRPAAETAGQKIRARGRLEDEESVRALQSRGLKVESLTPEARTEWRRLVEQVYPKVRGTMVPADIFDAVMASLAEYKAKSATPAATQP